MKSLVALLRGAALVGALVSTGSPAAAQAVTTGSVEGRVVDESGGVLPGATVALRYRARNISTTQTIGTAGDFKFLAVQVGTYELKSELGGFGTVAVHNITVDPGSDQRFTMQMKVGTLEESVQVTADAPLINTKDATESTMLNDKYLAALPLITRNYTEMPTVFPGVSCNRGANTPEFFASYIAKPTALVNSIQTGTAGQARDVPPDSAKFLEISAGGPIRNDKLWYYAVQYNEENQDTVLSPDPAPIANTFCPTHLRLTNRIDDDVPLPPGAFFVDYYDPVLKHTYTRGPSPMRIGVRDETRARLASAVTKATAEHSIKFGAEISETFGQQPGIRRGAAVHGPAVADGRRSCAAAGSVQRVRLSPGARRPGGRGKRPELFARSPHRRVGGGGDVGVRHHQPAAARARGAAPARRRQPTSADVRNELGRVYLRLDRPGDALAEFERAQQLDPAPPRQLQ